MLKVSNDINLIEPVPLVRLMLLLMIKLHPDTTGYSLINYINQFSKNTVLLRTGTVYNELRKMEKSNFTVSSLDDGNRKKRCYKITKEGEIELNRLISIVKTKKAMLLDPLVETFDKIDK